jgi:hypothetical protein
MSTCNLAGQLGGDRRLAVLTAFLALIQTVPEHYREARLSDPAIFCALGLTDEGVVRLGQEGFVVLADDAALYARLLGFEVKVINFNHLRDLE